MVSWLEQCKEVIKMIVVVVVGVCEKKQKTMPTGEPIAFAGEDCKLLSINARCRG